MSDQAAFSEISPSEFRVLYESGFSINEIVSKIHRSYCFVRNHLLKNGTLLRTKADGARLYLERHPEWKEQFIKYRISNPNELTEDKIRLLAMLITEGYMTERDFGFTNTQTILKNQFKALVKANYGKVNVYESGNLVRISSKNIAKNLQSDCPNKAFSTRAFRRLIGSHELTRSVLRIFADTEGAIILSPKKARRNYTLGAAIVLASRNVLLSKQMKSLFSKLDIRARMSPNGLAIVDKNSRRRFAALIGFSSGLKVIRKKAGHAVWYGHDKATLTKVALHVQDEQDKARRLGFRGCFANCQTKQDVLNKLKSSYNQIQGGDKI